MCEIKKDLTNTDHIKEILTVTIEMSSLERDRLVEDIAKQLECSTLWI